MPDPKPDKSKLDFSMLEQYSKESEWRMRNQDGIEYGPYNWEHLLQFAKEGRIALTSELKNSIATNGNWIRAQRITVIAALIASQTPPTSTVAVQSTIPTDTTLENSLFEAIGQAGRRKPFSANSDNSNSFFDIFDWSFKRYAAPWVIRVLWLVFVVVWFLSLVFGIVFNISVIVTGSWTELSGETPERVAYTIPFLVLIMFLGIAFQLLFLLIVRIIFESFIAIFDISNSLKRIAASSKH